MRRKRVLIVADSVVIRRSLTEALAPAPAILVVGTAASARIALMKIPLLCPDIVALDMETPETAGVATLSAIHTAYPTLPVIMLGPSGLAEALALGPVASVIKACVSARAGDSRDLLGAEIAAKIMQHCPEQPCFTAIGGKALHAPPLPTDGSRTEVRVDVLAIAVSTGGPSALMDLIPRFAKDFPVPIVIVQHMPPAFTALLAQRIAARSSISVVEGSLNQTLAPGCAAIAPGDFHMAVARDGDAVRVRVHQEPPENSCRPSADVLFRSVAAVYGRHVLAVVMTGMGRDGLNGCEHVRAAGGQIIVQDEESSVVWGMPGFIVRAGMADQVLPLCALGPEIIRKVWHRRRRAANPAIAPGLCAPRAREAGRL
jgi:two-component system, chemotaxis family, protein-glutamate methylesterase/glutaminase